MDKFRALFIPVLMASVATVQMAVVHTAGLNSWRGGGFGMYARFHPRNAEVWFEIGSTRQSFAKYDKNAGDQSTAVNWSLTLVNQSTATDLLNALSSGGKTVERLAVYRLDFDADNMKLTRKLLAEATQNER